MHPVIFQTKFFTLYTFWIFFAIAIIATTYAIISLSKKNNLKIQFLSDNTLKLILLSIIGARIGAVLFNYQNYFYELSSSALLSIFHIWDKGLNPWTGILTFIIFFAFICKRNDQNFWRWMDIIVPSVILGIAISSLGAFFDGINYGRETGLPWGVNFESPQIKYTVPIHPTQIYAFIYSGLLAISLFLIDQSTLKQNKLEGFVALSGIFIYSILRFLEEFVRGDDAWLILGIRLPQIFAFSMIIISGIFLFLRYNEHCKKSHFLSNIWKKIKSKFNLIKK